MSSNPRVSDVSDLLLQARDVRFSYSGATRADAFQLAVDHLDVHAGEVLALCGPSGSGKSTFLSILAGLLPPSSGRLLLETSDGKRDLYRCGRAEWRSQRREFGFVFQDPRESLNDRRTVLDIVTDPLRIHGIPAESPEPKHFFDRVAKWFGTAGPAIRRTRRAVALDALNKVGIKPAQALRSPQNLSGGQRQRVAIARALVARPRLLFLDGPTSALDVSVQASVANLLEELHREDRRLAYVLVTHDLALARQLADRIAVFDQGRIAEVGAADQILESPASTAAQRLLEITRSDYQFLSP